jgi:DNA-binding LacI/PurR family transcriptional regulator
MKAVAEQAGVTQATVSMSLANHPRIPEGTRKRIQELAAKLGYRPNPYVAALMRVRRSRSASVIRPVIALVNCLESKNAWRETISPTIRQMRLGAIEQVKARGYKPQEFWLYEEGMSATRFGGMLKARGIQGVLLGPLAHGAPPPTLSWDDFSVVRLGVPVPELTLTSVCNDHFFSSLQIVRETHRLGYRRPGLVILQTHRQRFHGRWEGGIQIGRDLLPGVKPRRALLLDSFEELEPLEKWLAQEKPDLVVCPNPGPVIAKLLKLGLKVPRQIGVASLACPHVGHKISGIWQNGALLGAMAVDQIISMLERNQHGLPLQASVFMVEGVWNIGQTLRQA